MEGRASVMERSDDREGGGLFATSLFLLSVTWSRSRPG